MTEDNFLDARDLMAKAIERAVLVVGYVRGRDETVTVDILEDGRAVLTSWQSCGDYDGGSTLESEQQYFPAHLLFCSEKKVTEWKAEEKRIAAELYREQDRLRSLQKEETERAIYQSLKSKYG